MNTISFRRFILTTMCALTYAPAIFAQVCTFTAQECCGEGITHFQLNGTPAINRTSTVTENGGFTNTGLSTTVVAGMTYAYSVTFPVENNVVNCNTYNFRIYVDYNHNDLLTDPGELVDSLDNVPNGTYFGSFTIPVSALSGDAYMRVMMKMAASSLSGGLCGHTPVTPCNSPADPVGFHGEVENYTLKIIPATGLSESQWHSPILISPNPASDRLKVESAEWIYSITLTDLSGHRFVHKDGL